MSEISIRETYAGKHILITGGSGFVGKVWLAMILDRLPEVGRVYVLLRGRGRAPNARFERIVSESMVFSKLHEKLGEEMSAHVSRLVEVVEGDVSLPGMGVDPEVAERLHRSVDLVINCAGLVEFNPDLRDALGSNVDGAKHVADFVEACDHAALLHVSTCYVAGQRDGFIGEEVRDQKTPNGKPFDVVAEYAFLQSLVDEVQRENDSPQTEQQLRADVCQRMQERGYEQSEARLRETVKRLKRKRLREKMAEAGTERARALGWTNTYTYTKAMAERLLRTRPGLRLAVFRPAIVESAVEFPFPGWNEGFNTCGPLVYLTGTWFRHVPAKPDNPLDVIPVDVVVKSILLAGAELLLDVHAPVYQCGTSERHALTVERLTELSALGHRRHLRKHGANKREKLVLARWDAVASSPEHVLNISNVREAVVQIRRYLRNGLPQKLPSEVKDWAEDLAGAADTAQRKLRQIEEIIDLFLPFTHDHHIVFESQALYRNQVVEPEFRSGLDEINWRWYWLDVHLPGLRRWCFPKYENKDVETYTPKTPFRMLPQPASEHVQSREPVRASLSAGA